MLDGVRLAPAQRLSLPPPRRSRSRVWAASIDSARPAESQGRLDASFAKHSDHSDSQVLKYLAWSLSMFLRQPARIFASGSTKTRAISTGGPLSAASQRSKSR